MVERPSLEPSVFFLFTQITDESSEGTTLLFRIFLIFNFVQNYSCKFPNICDFFRYRNYQKSNGSTSVEERDEIAPQDIKFEDDESDDDCNAADFLETSLNSNNALSLPEASPANFASASSSQLAQLTAQNINGNGSLFSNVSSDRLANQDSFPRIWVNSFHFHFFYSFSGFLSKDYCLKMGKFPFIFSFFQSIRFFLRNFND